MDLSVVLSTYIGDNPDELKEAFQSIVEQTHLPDEVIIVKDGKVTEEISNVINSFKEESPFPVHIETLSKNRGQGAARREGVNKATGDLIAFHDADDICYPERFESQIKFLKQNPDIDIVGSQIEEISTENNSTTKVRDLPLTHKKIKRFARYRSPVNQTTVMARRKDVIDAGNYRNVDRMEDYDLWVRMIVNGSKFANIDEPLVRVRGGTNMYRRRGGFEYAREEIRQQIDFLKYGFLTPIEVMINISIRVPIRLMPNQLRGIIYSKFLRNEK